ncbi:MAG TPA: hypothetical protein PKA53_11020, partial [Sphingobacterium sp.]|nr:hypothetical protein [Sphingobacterium sp.]
MNIFVSSQYKEQKIYSTQAVKKFLLSSGAAILLAVGAQAQTEFGLKAGVNLASYSYGDPEALSEAKPIVSYYA